MAAEKAKELQLVERAQVDADAFSELYELYFQKIYAYVSWRIGNESDAEDVVSDIFMKALVQLKTFKAKEGASFSSWLYRIAHNTVIDFYRKSKKRITVDIEDVAEMQVDDPSIEDVYRAKECFIQTQSFLRMLPQKQAEVVTMSKVLGLNNKEIATILKIRERSVSSYLHRGIEKLRFLHQEKENAVLSKSSRHNK